ncbi:MAG: hypothetical protein KBC38_02345 [Candidatus Pacebacteria bacterium]|nr:hypothetical protein [Candidatus Paceibacterota bacterium]MBP9840635.1 hypothetical protein [Candidatus Paceibacterota bacterium]
MRTEEIRNWLESLTRSYGNPRRSVEEAPLRALYDAKDWPGLVSRIKTTLLLGPLRVKLRLVAESKETAPMWINGLSDMPMFGTKEFNGHTVTLSAKSAFLRERSFETIVLGFAHELCHAVADAVRQEYFNIEETIDLTAMFLGFSNFYLKGAKVRVFRTAPGYEESLAVLKDLSPRAHAAMLKELEVSADQLVGYLSIEEIRYARALMRC